MAEGILIILFLLGVILAIGGSVIALEIRNAREWRKHYDADKAYHYSKKG